MSNLNIGDMEHEVPDVVGHLVGYKGLLIKDKRLVSYYDHLFEWRRGTNVALCNGDDEPAVTKDCDCGIYALRDVDAAVRHVSKDFRTGLMVRIHGWGTAVVGDAGWRSKRARIDAIMAWDMVEVERYSRFGYPIEVLPDEFVTRHRASFHNPAHRLAFASNGGWHVLGGASVIPKDYDSVGITVVKDASKERRRAVRQRLCSFCGIPLRSGDRYLRLGQSEYRMYCVDCGKRRLMKYEALLNAWRDMGSPVRYEVTVR